MRTAFLVLIAVLVTAVITAAICSLAWWGYGKNLTRSKDTSTDQSVTEWLEKLASKARPASVASSKASFAWSTNITDENAVIKTEKGLIISNIWASATSEAYKKFNASEITDADLARLITNIQSGRVGSTPEEREENAKISNRLETTYSVAKICPPNISEPCDDKVKIPLDPDLTEMMRKSRNETELRIIWQRWRNVAGKPSKKDFFDLIARITEQNARVGYTSMTQRLLKDYEDDAPDFRGQLWDLYEQIIPLYEDLHAYVRYKLNKFYGPKIVPPNGTVPAHLFGNMWAQSWANIYDLLEPYPNATNAKPSITKAMVTKNWTAEKIFHVAEDFFQSVGMPALPPKFWQFSMIERPSDGREVECHASAWDIDYRDVRINMCTRVNQEDFSTVHHELGHIYYYLAYENQSIFYQTGANSGFHDAVGDTILISAEQDVYLKSLGLLDTKYTPSAEVEINALMKKGLTSIVFFPYGYLLDLWRWDNYDGVVKERIANDHYWSLRERFQGIHPPVDRKPDDFDPPAKYHVSNFVPYVRYLVARFLQYDFHDALCKGDDTSTCSIFKDKEAGEKLWQMLKLGSSERWPEALKTVTGRGKMSAKPVLRYFKDLANWLRKENKKNKVCIGWGQKWPESVKLNHPRCP